LEGCEAFVHLAAHGVSMQALQWPDCFRWNVEASLSLLLDACRLGVRRFIICGSCSEYGRAAERYASVPADAPLLPTEPYGASKAALSMAALGLSQDRNVELIILRPFHVYGEGEAPARFWPSLRAAARAGTDFPMTGGEQVRDLTPVELVARGFADALIRSDLTAGQPLIENLGTGLPSSLKDFAAQWWRKWQAPGKLILGAVPYRRNEVMRYVPEVPPRTSVNALASPT
jgi:nucleoside-diphosphate-sugar epimerase